MTYVGLRLAARSLACLPLNFFEAPQKRFVTPKNPPGIEKRRGYRGIGCRGLETGLETAGKISIPQKRASLFWVEP
eukprot:7381551-Prymnesium_polylepis.1